jgi:hypothetical protein
MSSVLTLITAWLALLWQRVRRRGEAIQAAVKADAERRLDRHKSAQLSAFRRRDAETTRR